jgi:serine/threonine protein kinase/Flp pilus assembly protein TadD
MGLSSHQMVVMSRLLDEALPLDEAARRVWLENLSTEYRDLATPLREALLPGDARGSNREALSTLPKFGAGDEGGSVAASALAPGARIGPYVLIRPLGAGGMAEVWLARRADGAIKREEALKIPKLAREDLALRFARERDILASLEHPNIARLYDVGSDAQGRPYLAMEYVQGQPLTEWCDSHKMGIPERLKLFLQVLEAVQHAHERQVIHRDLKPSNILVTDSGQVRLLDFGIAKLLEDEAGETQLTSVHGRALTPDYASPEMLRGGAIEARSDVYSLGIILYELLSGARPYRLASAASIGGLEQAIGTVQIQKPSTRIEVQASNARATLPEKLGRQLRGDLDLITLKALARNPEERFQSAAEFAEDLRRYLNGQPIRARPARFPYRARKWLRRNRTAVAAAAMVALLAVIGYTLQRSVWNRRTETVAAVFAPPPHSIAVLPFVNLSGDPSQEYFSDGLTEELLNSLSEINELQVAARTSAFSFKGKDTDIGTIARKLNVGALLEGSVRRSGNTIRITTQLINAVTGFHLWSHTYDRDLGDVLTLETEIAGAVASALKVRLLGDVATKIELGGTRNPAAFDAYLRGRKSSLAPVDKDRKAAIAAYTEAIGLDPTYALAFANRSIVLSDYASEASGPAVREGFDKAQLDAQKAVKLAPDLAEAHLALAAYLESGSLDFAQANEEYERALALAPGNARVLRDSGAFAVYMGRTEAGVAAVRRAVELDPLNAYLSESLGIALYNAGQYKKAIAAYQDEIALDPEPPPWGLANLGFAYYALGDFERARDSCESAPKPGTAYNQVCLAMTYEKLARHADAESMLNKMQTSLGDAWALQYAEIHAEWGNYSRALEWLETALKLRDPGLEALKVDPHLDPLRKEPRFQAIERALKFPN